MKLNIKAYATAQTFAAAVLYVICTFLISFSPETAINLAGYILHLDVSGIMKTASVSSFIVGLLLVSIGWGLLSLIMAGVYNRLTNNTA